MHGQVQRRVIRAGTVEMGHLQRLYEAAHTGDGEGVRAARRALAGHGTRAAGAAPPPPRPVGPSPDVVQLIRESKRERAAARDWYDSLDEEDQLDIDLYGVTEDGIGADGRDADGLTEWDRDLLFGDLD